MIAQPTILALDFDGVICNGLNEYFETAWRTYCEIWSRTDKTPPNDLATKFYRLRPVIETGWEMPVLIAALLSGVTEDKILREWNAIARAILQKNQLQSATIAHKLDSLRDRWIRDDLASWLNLHSFYPGVIAKLNSWLNSPLQVFIVTTKEGRFVRQLLAQQGIQLSENSVFGKENKRPKYEILYELITAAKTLPVSLWFVEDRMKTLEIVAQQANLDAVKLYLADWGYNTSNERQAAQNHDRIRLLSLAQFTDDFSTWG
ncbi:HAD family hydrolase [Chroococcidiopsis sp. TS-821]|uniref:HAD family hydrolase n=1 Tax=Chroococcidiopsis sp. TS-821 TaxID=1378066 RepID=UPI000CEECCAD|nr:HAD hydrolase-like protein [Chroococcidiopsis sp. TS-821]PPS40622.1 haloacid dehalogenase [Chroococcidiopsis sp. TS-821]